jgi:NADH-quinone oxidoreductase subunit J
VVGQNIAFGVMAAVVVLAAVRVVTTQNVVHAALYLVAVLAGVGATYILLAAEFLAVVQVLVYIGAIVVLFLFGIMLTRATIGRERSLDGDQRGVAALVALLLGGMLAFVLIDAFGGEEVEVTAVQRTREVGDVLFTSYLVPFMAASVLLLAALVGAIVLARRD